MSQTKVLAGAAIGADGVARTPWALQHPLLLEYYDHEWGRPVTSEEGLFERVVLESFQSGLSWLTILKKREAFRELFAGFDPEVVADWGQEDVERLLAEPRIIRNRAKIESAITNARRTVDLRDEGGLAALLWSFAPQQSCVPASIEELPSQSAESTALAKELRGRGFRFVGPTTVFALMEAVGMVDGHVAGSALRGVSGLRNADGVLTSAGRSFIEDVTRPRRDALGTPDCQ